MMGFGPRDRGRRRPSLLRRLRQEGATARAPAFVSRRRPTALERRVGPDAQFQFVAPVGDEREWPRPERARSRRGLRRHARARDDAPPNREFLTPKFLVGTIAVKPPPVEVNRRRRRTLRRILARRRAKSATFVETLTTDKLAAASPGTEKAAVTAAARRAAAHGASDHGDRDHPGAHAPVPPLPRLRPRRQRPARPPLRRRSAIAASAAVNAAIAEVCRQVYAAGSHE